jgi:hypothetical protein
MSWTLDSTGPERLPKTIYVRFGDATQTFTDDIILDETAPTVLAAAFGPKAGSSHRASAAAARARTYTIRVRARDNVSGVAGLQATANRSRPSKLQPYRTTARVKASSSRLWIRVRDRAGNFSRWRKVATKQR